LFTGNVSILIVLNVQQPDFTYITGTDKLVCLITW